MAITTYTLPDKYDATPRNRRRLMFVLACLFEHLEPLGIRLIRAEVDMVTLDLSVTLDNPIPQAQRQHILNAAWGVE